MPSLPAASAFTGSAVTEGDFKTAITDLRGFLAGVLGTDGTVATALATLGAGIAGYEAKSSAYTVVSGDRGKMLACDGTWTLSLTAAATLGAGFAFTVVNAGSGTITIDPASTEQVDGATTLAVGAGLSALIVCTGTAWRSAFLQLTPPSAGRLLRVTRYNSAGSGTWTKGSDVGSIMIECVGAGGGAGRGGTDVDGVKNGLGGGGGGYAAKYIGSPSASYAYTVGAGGAAASTELTAGSAGGATTIESIVCNGGAGGGYGVGIAGGAGGSSSGGNRLSPGGDGILTVGGSSAIGCGRSAAAGGRGAGGGGNIGNGAGTDGRDGYIEIWEFS